ncbi:MAG: TetR/AcrR family transcriptional regulator [Anaerolineae bacterium]|nr:TetR/AcrR family transcriptional regulator [Anaerolineae bacterium]
MEKIDRRKQRSRNLIKDAFLSLLMDKPFHDITIQEIADAADVGRATFYLHYRSKEECLMKILTQGFDSLSAQYNKPSKTPGEEDQIEKIKAIFDHTTKNRKLYLALLNSQHAAVSFISIQDYIADKILSSAPYSSTVDPVSRKATAVFLAGALYNMQIWWLKEQPPIDSREAAELFVKFATYGCFKNAVNQSV